jgi:trehalose synthase
VEELQLARFREALGPQEFELLQAAIARAQEILEGRVVWNINSTAKGGGVAELLRSLLAYARGAGIVTRWLVVEGESDFFKVTKRLHNHLHGAIGDGGELGPAEIKTYERTVQQAFDAIKERVRPRDIVIVHDPQPAALVGPLIDLGAIVFWRCHIGIDHPNDLVRHAWDILRSYVSPAHAYIFSRREFAWEALDLSKLFVIPPSIDAFSPKNQELSGPTVNSILATTGLIGGEVETAPGFSRWDGSRSFVEHRTRLIEEGTTPSSAELVLQVSRWDRLKDPVGVIRGFVDHVAFDTDAHLVVAGPMTDAVSDDPEGAQVLEEVIGYWRSLSEPDRHRVHLACLPMEDGEENAAIVNALQRRATIVVQKSLAEGFGLTVSEAMWKARPLVASRIGGIQDQISDGTTGILVEPSDLASYGRAVLRLLNEPERATAMGERAQEHVRRHYLGPRHLMQYLHVIESTVG